MNITLSPELQKRVAEKVERGSVGTADALVEEALEQGARGEGRSGKEVFANLRAKYRISR